MRPNGYFCFVAFRKESIQLKNLIVESCLRRIILRLFIPEMFSLLYLQLIRLVSMLLIPLGCANLIIVALSLLHAKQKFTKPFFFFKGRSTQNELRHSCFYFPRIKLFKEIS